VFTSALFILPKILNKPKCPSSNEGNVKYNHTLIHIMEYYLTFMKKILPSVTTLMKLEDIILNEISQTQKEKYYAK
jgi:hypothetical protein